MPRRGPGDDDVAVVEVHRRGSYVGHHRTATVRRRVPLRGMTEQLERPESHEAVIAEALTVIDQALAR